MKLLCTDLDRTLIPNGEQPESALARPLLWHLLDTHATSLVYVSGRDLTRVLDGINEYALQIPDAIVADVGSSIYLPTSSGWVKNTNWQKTIATDWNGQTGDEMKRQLTGIQGLRAQEASRQATLKSSYYFSLDADRDLIREQVAAMLQSVGVSASLVLSDDLESNVGLLDVLPQQATKSGAVGFIRSLMGVGPQDTLFAGDSGNDIAALVSEVASVAVANADADTQQAVKDQAAQMGTSDNTYQAVGGVRVAESEELNGNYAAGILEGLIQFRPAWHADLLDPEWVANAKAKYAQLE